MAGLLTSVARKFFSAMRNGSRCVDAHEKVLKLKPDYYDAYLSIGVYDYIAGGLPFGYKLMASMVGVRGNKKRGSAGSKPSSKITPDGRRRPAYCWWPFSGTRSGMTTRSRCSNNSALNIREAISLKLERASALVTLNRMDEAYAVFDGLLKDPAATSALDLIHYQYAEALARNKEHRRAAAEFTAVCQVEGARRTWRRFRRLRAAQMYDLAGERQEAMAQYKEVLARPNVYDTKQQAEKGMNRPFMGK